MKHIYVIRSSRISLIKHLFNHFRQVNGYKTHVIDIKNVKDLEQYYNSIQSGSVKYIVFSNGTDNIDKQIYQKCLELNPNQEFLFSENAWLTWQNYIYLDPNGIGNLSELFSFTKQDVADYSIDKTKVELCTKTARNLLSIGTKLTDRNYILVPLQVDNDSKLLVGSPFFKKVSEFVSYMIDTTPNDINIFFKNHPHNKNKCPIPKKQNVYDITMTKYSKESLINNSLYVAGINTTFLIESMFLNHSTVTYGLDVFSNKDIIVEGYNKSVDEIMKYEINTEIRNKFLEILMSRQVKKVQ